jgi:hypothetical protein
LGELELSELERVWESSWHQQEIIVDLQLSPSNNKLQQAYDEVTDDVNASHFHDKPMDVYIATYDTSANMELFYGQSSSQ